MKHVGNEKIAWGNCEMATVFTGICQNTVVTPSSFAMVVHIWMQIWSAVCRTGFHAEPWNVYLCFSYERRADTGPLSVLRAVHPSPSGTHSVRVSLRSSGCEFPHEEPADAFPPAPCQVWAIFWREMLHVCTAEVFRAGLYPAQPFWPWSCTTHAKLLGAWHKALNQAFAPFFHLQPSFNAPVTSPLQPAFHLRSICWW